MRISDWSSDVCSSDLGALHRRRGGNAQQHAARLSRPDNVDTGLIALHGKCRWRPAARQLLDTDSPARSGAYAASLRDINSVKSRTCFVLRVSPCVRSQSVPRSEEHTSELQSLMRISYAVFCLKKKTRDTAEKETDTVIVRDVHVKHMTNA